MIQVQAIARTLRVGKQDRSVWCQIGTGCSGRHSRRVVIGHNFAMDAGPDTAASDKQKETYAQDSHRDHCGGAGTVGL